MPELPLLTRTHVDWSDFQLPNDSCFIYARSSEKRSEHPSQWEKKQDECRFIEVINQRPFDFSVIIDDSTQDILVRSNAALSHLISQIDSTRLFVDITGLEHHIWASLLRAIIREQRPVSAVYVEPERYKYSSNPTEGRLFDLTDKFTEIGSFPGFTRLESTGDESRTCFVPFLGFEGNRLAHAIEKIDPPVEKTFPVVGIPGFRADFPFNTYIGNRGSLSRDGLWKRVRFAIANSPTSAMERLRAIEREYPDHLLKIAPLGTRPHALGALLFALSGGPRVELVYDNPTPAMQRSDGTGRILVYDVTSMVSYTVAQHWSMRSSPQLTLRTN